MNLLTSLIPEPYSTYLRVGLIVLLVGGAYGTGYLHGDHHVEYRIQKQIIHDQAKAEVIHDTQIVVDTKATDALQSKLDAVNAKNLLLLKQVSEGNHATLLIEPPANSTEPPKCVLSKEWVDAYNQSIGAP